MRQAAAASADEPEWARTDADPSDGTEEGTESTARNPLRQDADAEQGNGDADDAEQLSATLPSPPMYSSITERPKLLVCTPGSFTCMTTFTTIQAMAYILTYTAKILDRREQRER